MSIRIAFVFCLLELTGTCGFSAILFTNSFLNNDAFGMRAFRFKTMCFIFARKLEVSFDHLHTYYDLLQSFTPKVEAFPKKQCSKRVYQSQVIKLIKWNIEPFMG